MPGAIARWRRYSEIASTFVRHGLSALVAESGLARYAGRARVSPAARARSRGEQLRLALEELGPTFVKLGQFLSTRPDLLPPDVLRELAVLQDEVPPFPAQQAVAIIEQDLGAALGGVFSHFEMTPAASASLGQVHHARLLTGEEVAVKVQRPGILEPLETDLAILHRTAHFLQERSRLSASFDFTGTAEQFERSIREELDYHQEESNVAAIRDNLASFECLHIPTPYPRFSSRRVLTLERIFGHKLTQLPPTVAPERLRLLAREFIKAYLKQVGVDGLFHSDPHPGNVWIDDQGRLVLLDFGMVARLDESDRERFIRLLAAFAEGNGERVAAVLLELSPTSMLADTADFRREIVALVARQQTAAVEAGHFGRSLLEMTQAAYRNGVRLPSTATMLGKALLNADGVAYLLDPELQPVEVIRDYMTQLAASRAKAFFSRARLVRLVTDTADLLLDLPSRLNRLGTRLSDEGLRVSVEVDDLSEVLIHMRKIANRITFGLVNGAIIVGSALVAQIPAGPTLAGYPAVATAGFLIAAIMGFYMLIDILLTDRPVRKR